MKTIPGFPDYAITKDGRVWSKPRKYSPKGIWLTPRIIRNYLVVDLYIDSQEYTCKIHKLVLITFIGPRQDGLECRHLDGNPQNNNLDNLCWGTHQENMQDRKKHGTGNQGVKHPMVKLTERQVRQIIYTHRTGLFTQKEIVNQYNIARTIISRIVNKKIWKHLWAA